MNKIIILASAINPTEIDCVKLKPALGYSDTIIKGFDYNNVTQKNIQIINYCDVPFNIIGFSIFEDTVNGGNFSATVNDFTILAGQTLNIPVIYNGIYLGSNLTPAYSISINGISSIYDLIVSVPVINNPPIITDIIFDLGNRQDYVITLADFLAHFTDLDGDTLDAVIIEGNTTQFRLSGNPILSGTEISQSQINAGLLTRIAPDTDNYISESTLWKAKDSAGTISL